MRSWRCKVQRSAFRPDGADLAYLAQWPWTDQLRLSSVLANAHLGIVSTARDVAGCQTSGKDLRRSFEGKTLKEKRLRQGRDAVDRRPTVIELFSGVGGTSLGFDWAGFNVRLGLDSDPVALDIFAKNHDGAVPYLSAVEEVTGEELLRAAKLKAVDVLVGGPSCQGYSTIGKRIEDDPRNMLFTHYIRLVDEIRPTWILFENVRGMVIHGRGRFLKELQSSLCALGYVTKTAILNAADYGVPQRRERLLLVGTRASSDLGFPVPTHQDPRCRFCSRPDRSNRVRSRLSTSALDLFSRGVCPRCKGTALEPIYPDGLKPWVSVGDAIGDLPPLGTVGGNDQFVRYSRQPRSTYQRLMRKGSRGYSLHRARPVSDFARSIISQVPEGAGIRHLSEAQLPGRFRVMRTISNGQLRRDCTTLYYRLSRKMPSYTITCYSANVSSGAFTHPLADRAITIREAARLQSFPDSFWLDAKNARRHIGNAVPPLLAMAVAERMKVDILRTKRSRSRRRSTKEAPEALSAGPRRAFASPQPLS